MSSQIKLNRSYLSDRVQSTQIGPDISNKQPKTCRVPQGSVLGPLLLLLYVNDIHKSSDKLAFYLFADDTNLLCKDKNLRTLELVVNLEFHKVYEWLTAYKLTLNVKKSNFIIFHPHQKKINHQLNLKLLDNDPKPFLPLEQKLYVKYLWIENKKLRRSLKRTIKGFKTHVLDNTTNHCFRRRRMCRYDCTWTPAIRKIICYSRARHRVLLKLPIDNVEDDSWYDEDGNDHDEVI